MVIENAEEVGTITAKTCLLGRELAR
jgi:hypothetical protein